MLGVKKHKLRKITAVNKMLVKHGAQPSVSFPDVISFHLRHVSESRGITIRQLAKMVGVRRAWMERLFRGDVNLEVSMLYRTCQALDICPIRLLKEAEIFGRELKELGFTISYKDLSSCKDSVKSGLLSAMAFSDLVRGLIRQRRFAMDKLSIHFLEEEAPALSPALLHKPAPASSTSVIDELKRQLEINRQLWAEGEDAYEADTSSEETLSLLAEHSVAAAPAAVVPVAAEPAVKETAAVQSQARTRKPPHLAEPECMPFIPMDALLLM